MDTSVKIERKLRLLQFCVMFMQLLLLSTFLLSQACDFSKIKANHNSLNSFQNSPKELSGPNQSMAEGTGLGANADIPLTPSHSILTEAMVSIIYFVFQSFVRPES